MPSPTPSTTRRTDGIPAWPSLALAAAALALYAAALPTQVYGDGVRLAHMLERGPAPYYNLGYLPAAWLFHALLEPLCGWTPLAAMAWFSAVCGAAALGLLVRALLLLGLEAGLALALALLVALAPGTWFFCSATEVHGLQLLGLVFGCVLALRARRASGLRALAWVAAAALAPMLAHSTGLLMAPAVAALGLGTRWRSLASLARTALGLLLGLGAGFALAALAREWSRAHGGPERAGLDLFTMLTIGRGALDRSAAGDSWFGWAEIAEFLSFELVQPAALLLVSLPLVLLRANRPLVLPLALALAPGLLLFPQGHIRENGAYYLSVYPFLALLAVAPLEHLRTGLARTALLPTLILLALPQAWLGWRKLAAHQRGLDLPDWGTSVEAALAREPPPPPGTPQPVFFVSSLPRFDWFVYLRPIGEVHDVLRALDLVPRRKHARTIDAILGIGAEQLGRGGAVYLDAELLDDPHRPAFLGDFEARLRSFPVRLEALAPAPGGPTVLYAIRADAPGSSGAANPQ